MPILYSPRTTADAAAFRETLDTVCKERRYLAFLEAPPLEGVSAFIADLTAQACPQWVAWDGPALIGWADLIRGSEHMGKGHSGRLGMGLLPAYRGQGIGRTLLEKVIEDARRLKLLRLELEVYASNTAALGLYKRLGFNVEGRCARARYVDGIYDDTIAMALFLD